MRRILVVTCKRSSQQDVTCLDNLPLAQAGHNMTSKTGTTLCRGNGQQDCLQRDTAGSISLSTVHCAGTDRATKAALPKAATPAQGDEVIQHDHVEFLPGSDRTASSAR